MIDQNKWRWYGNVAHLIVGQDCRFHLATEVGDVLVSTVGEYLPDEGARELLAAVRRVKITGRGDERRANYLKLIGYEDLGGDCGYKYETMVFRIGSERCECGCGLPVPTSWTELTGTRYKTSAEANTGHLRACERASSGAFDRALAEQPEN